MPTTWGSTKIWRYKLLCCKAVSHERCFRIRGNWKTNNAPDSFKMKTPGHSNLCVYVKYLYKGTRLCNYEAIKLQFLCQNISCINPAKYGIRSFFKCLRSQKGKDYMRNQDQGITVFLSCNKSYLRYFSSLIARKYIQDQYLITFLSG